MLDPHNTPLALLRVGGISLLAYGFGSAVQVLTTNPGPYAGIVAAVTGALVALVIEGIKASVTVWQSRTARQVQEALALEKKEQALHAEQIRFYQAQINYHSELEVIARNRAHRSINELQRAYMAIRNLEEMKKACDCPEGLAWIPFRFKLNEELFGKEDLPVKPIQTQELQNEKD